MRKLHLRLILTALAVFGYSLSSRAQAFPESFEGAFPPTGWTVFDNGIGTVESWTTTTTAQAGAQAAYIQYESGFTGTAEDWLVSPTVAITPTSSILSYWERETYTSDWFSVYNVLVSTSSQTNTSTFTLVATYPENTVNPLTYRSRIINLSAYIGQTVYIAFRMDNNDGDDWYLDDIQLTGGCVTAPSVGVISGVTSTSLGVTNQYSVSSYSGNLQWYSGSSSTGPWTAIAGATMNPQNITATMGGTMYLIAVASSSAAGCLDDTTNVAHAVNVFFPADDACTSIPLPVGPSSTYYQLYGASVQSGEVMPPAGTCTSQVMWCNNTLDNTLWFSFTAPASGHVIIQSPDFDTQLAVWQAPNCSALYGSSSATFVCANDDDPMYSAHGGVTYSSYLHAGCLTPGATYWLQLDSYSSAGPGDSTRVIITDGVTPFDASFTGVNSIYCLPTTGTPLVPTNDGGIFTVDTYTNNISNFNPTVLGVGTHTVYYTVSGCVSNSAAVVANTPTVSAVSSTSLLCTGQSATLTASGASTYSWMPSGSGSSIVVSPTTTTTYSVVGSNSVCSGSASVVQNVSACTGIQAIASATGLKIYPNPNNGSFVVSTEAIPSEIVVTDVLGNKVYSVKPNTSTVSIDIHSFEQGIYFVNVKTDKGNTITKVIKE